MPIYLNKEQNEVRTKFILVPTGQEAGRSPEPVWMQGWGEKFPAPTGTW